MRRQLHRTAAVRALGIGLLLSGCSGSNDEAPARTSPSTATSVTSPPPAEQPVSGSIEVYDQTSDGTTLMVEKATMNGAPGWIVVHVDEGGPGPVIACAPIPQGTSPDVAVPLAPRVATGAYWPMLHRDAGQLGVCEWPGGPDGPVRPPSGAITYATRKVILTVP